MAMPSDALASRVQDSFLKLSTVATDLNAASDELGKFIGELDSSIRTLNLGIECWIPFRDWTDDRFNYESDQIGYAKLDRRWGLAVRSLAGNENYPEGGRSESWLFNDSPRALRIEAVGKIPDLLDELAKTAVATTKQISEKAKEAQALASAIHPKPVALPPLPGHANTAKIVKGK